MGSIKKKVIYLLVFLYVIDRRSVHSAFIVREKILYSASYSEPGELDMYVYSGAYSEIMSPYYGMQEWNDIGPDFRTARSGGVG